MYSIVFACPEVLGSKIVTREHLGISYLRSYLEHHHFSTRYQTHRAPLTIQEYIDFLQLEDTPVLGFSVTDDTAPLVLKIVDKVRSRFPSLVIVFGGAIASLEAARHFLKIGSCDAMVIGEGEYPTHQLLETIKAKEYNFSIPGVATWNLEEDRINFLVNSKSIKINSYPSPILSGLIPEEELPEIGIFTSRGCFYKCNFCSFSYSSNWKTRYFDEDRVLQEIVVIANAAKKHGKSRVPIAIWDDIFTIVLPRSKRILKKIIALNLDIEFWAQTRVNNLDREVVGLMKKAGIHHVGLGLESGAPSVLKIAQKVRLKDMEEEGTQPEIEYLKKFGLFKKWADEVQLKYTLNAIIGLPGEGYSEAIKTLEFIDALEPEYYFHNIIRFYTGTPLARAKNEHYTSAGLNVTTFPKDPGVAAEITQYAYDVYSVPPLPYRRKSPYEYLVTGIDFELFTDAYASVLVEEASTVAQDWFDSDYFSNKHVFTRQYSAPSTTYASRLKTSTINQVNNLGPSVSGIQIYHEYEVPLSSVQHFDELLAHSFQEPNTHPKADEADTYYVLSIEDDLDFEMGYQLFETMKQGGSVLLPNNLTSIQFKGFLLKNSCRWSGTCPAETMMRNVLQHNKIKGCDSPNYTAGTTESVLMQERGCNSCSAKDHCSKCNAVPASFVDKYCEIQRSGIPLVQLFKGLDKVIAEAICTYKDTPLHYSENSIIFPKYNGSFQFAILIDDQYFYVFKLGNSFKMYEISNVLFELLPQYWEFESEDLLAVLHEKFNNSRKATMIYESFNELTQLIEFSK